MNYKRRRAKQARAGCLMCKPHKLSHSKTAARAKARREWQRRELA